MAPPDDESKPPAGEGPVEVEARINRTVFHSADSGYLVMRAQIPGELGLVTLVGHYDAIGDGSRVLVTGTWGNHPSHGRQFEFTDLQLAAPETLEGTVNLLSNYKGLGQATAQRVVDAFGLEVLNILDEQPERLLEVRGIGRETLKRIVEDHARRKGPVAELRKALLLLKESPTLASAIHRRFEDASLLILEEEPYRLAEVRGIGFVTADRIARKQGLEPDDPRRIDAGIAHILSDARRDGHCALPVEVLLRDTERLLARPEDELREGLDRLQDAKKLIYEGDEFGNGLLFSTELFFAEKDVALALATLALAEKPSWEVGELPDHLSEGQVAAVQALARNGVVVLTGGPGTGKSTVVRHVIARAEANDMELFLCAPPGRAAKRLEQTTEREAKTVHRLLEYQGDTGRFLYDDVNRLEPGLVVVDESSMLDIQLAKSLFGALTPEHRLVLVGDADQLPSVGAGNVLRDIINAADQVDSPIPVVRLDRIFRQAEGSTIVRNAHRVLRGESLESDPAGQKGQFFFTRTADAQRSHDVIVKLASERIPEVYGFDAVSEVQVLCPMHKGRAGTEAFNHTLQDIYTKGEPELALNVPGGRPPRKFRVGDRVMQTKNDYERGVFNGDIGTVVSVDADNKSLRALIDGIEVPYTNKELGALRLAYAISIHKSQGSEFPAVLLPLLGEHHVMLRRNLLYTAITRAQSLCIVVGDPRAVERAISRADAAHRWTGLEGRLRASFVEMLGGTVVELD